MLGSSSLRSEEKAETLTMPSDWSPLESSSTSSAERGGAGGTQCVNALKIIDDNNNLNKSFHVGQNSLYQCSQQ